MTAVIVGVLAVVVSVVGWLLWDWIRGEDPW